LTLARRKSRGASLTLARVLPFGSLAGLSVMAALPGGAPLPIAVALGAGAVFAGRRLFDRQRNARRELQRRARESVTQLAKAAREDGVAAPQMRRLSDLQDGVLAAWEMLSEEYRPMLSEDLHTVVDEVEAAALLARRRGALRRHLKGMDWRAVAGRVKKLEAEVAALPQGTELRARFEAALEGRRGELRAMEELPHAISAINAQLEGVESLLGNLRADLLALDADPGARYAGAPGLAEIKERVAYFKRGLDEVSSRSLADNLPLPDDEQNLDGPLTQRLPAR